MRIAIVALVALVLAAATSARADGECQAPILSDAPNGLGTIPKNVLDRALLQATLRRDAKGRPALHSVDAAVYAIDCRGHQAPAEWGGYKNRKNGTAVVGSKSILGDGRMATWIVTGYSEGAPAAVESGFLALVRYDDHKLVVDAIGAWENGTDAKRTLDTTLFAPRGFVEPTGHTGTGGGSDSVGRTVWVATANGELKKAGAFDVEGLESDMAADGPSWTMTYKATVKPGAPVRVVENITWTLGQGETITETVKQRRERTYTLDGDTLKEGPSKPRKPPHPASEPAPASPPGKPKTITKAVAQGELRLTFDPGKVSEAELLAAVELSPHAMPNGLVPQSLEVCIAADKRYRECGSRQPDAPNFVYNAEVNLAADRQEHQRWLAMKVPPELAPALEWVQRSVAFSLGLEERKLAFVKTKNLDELKAPLGGVDAAKVCARSLAAIAATADVNAKLRIALFDYHNCMNDAGQTQNGSEVPRAAWQAFVRARAIKEKLVAATGD